MKPTEVYEPKQYVYLETQGQLEDRDEYINFTFYFKHFWVAWMIFLPCTKLFIFKTTLMLFNALGNRKEIHQNINGNCFLRVDENREIWAFFFYFFSISVFSKFSRIIFIS